MDWLKLALGLLKAWNSLVALLRSWRDRESGKQEVILDVKVKSDDAVEKARAADAAVRDSIAAGGLRDDDGYKRN
jgi:hypothetical protein